MTIDAVKVKWSNFGGRFFMDENLETPPELIMASFAPATLPIEIVRDIYTLAHFSIETMFNKHGKRTSLYIFSEDHFDTIVVKMLHTHVSLGKVLGHHIKQI